MKIGDCSLCGDEIFDTDARDVHDQIVSWHTRRRRKGGGAHDKGKLWRMTGAIAHGKCIEEATRRARHGVPQKQVGLF